MYFHEPTSCITQWLEGERATVELLMRGIYNDRRQTNVELLAITSSNTRKFSTFGMEVRPMVNFGGVVAGPTAGPVVRSTTPPPRHVITDKFSDRNMSLSMLRQPVSVRVMRAPQHSSFARTSGRINVVRADP